MSSANRPLPQWQLPAGVTRGAWQYTQAEHIADQYDEYFACSDLFELDERVVARYLQKPGWVVDLGCGTGRAVVPLARRGFRCLAVDLSPHMLRIVGQKATAEGLNIMRLRANLVELDSLRDQIADYCLCLFSTIGMIQGRENRARALRHAWRILKPGGLLIIHVHNFWYHLLYPAGRRWILSHLAQVLFNRNLQRGDKFYDYLGIPQMYLHTYGERELLRCLRQAGFQLAELMRLDAPRQRPLRLPWLFGWLRANGWIVVCRRPFD